MAELDLGTLTDRLTEEEAEGILEKLRESTGVDGIPEGDISAADRLAEDIDDDVFAEFMDRLGAVGMACDFYLPVEFDGTVAFGEVTVGSVHTLKETLEDLMDDFDVEDPFEFPEEDEPDDDDEHDLGEDVAGDGEALQKDLRALWYLVYQGALEARECRLALIAVQ